MSKSSQIHADQASSKPFRHLDLAHNFLIFGDPAYGYGPHLASPFSDDNLTEQQKAWNYAMSQCRIEVEHGFGVIVTLWPFLNNWRKMLLLQTPVGRFYRVGVLLANALNCLRPNQVSQAFNCLPPTLDQYFHD
ncbi:hypothetical protein C8R42DRAFT_588463 [Lentinula raphanica]|nr:hypothetical protein C8R42DRAFT_588463 [Lentinula raphanica]